MNKPLIERRFRKGLPTYDQQADAQSWAARNVADMLTASFPKGCSRLLEIGCGTGLLTEQILQQIPVKELYLNDIVRESKEIVTEKITPYHTKQRSTPHSESSPIVHFLPGDAETIPFPDSMDAIASASTIQWFSDLPKFFGKAHQCLRPGGWLYASTFGPENLSEIKQLTGIGLKYPDTETLCKWLRKDFQNVRITEHKICMTFNTPREVLRHLKDTGVNGVLTPVWAPGTLRNFETRYNNLFLKDHQVPLTYHIILLAAQKTAPVAYPPVSSSYPPIRTNSPKSERNDWKSS